MAEQYSTDIISPEFVLALGDVLPTKPGSMPNKKADDTAMLLWICFGIALLILGSMAIMYWVKKCRERKMHLQ